MGMTCKKKQLNNTLAFIREYNFIHFTIVADKMNIQTITNIFLEIIEVFLVFFWQDYSFYTNSLGLNEK